MTIHFPVRRGVAAAVLLLTGGAALAEPFNGPYVGAELGWQQDRVTTRTTVGAPVLNGRDRKASFAYGGVLGYDATVAQGFVLGAEAQVSGAGGTVGGPGGIDYDMGRTVGLAARAGVLASPQTLVYGRGGWSNARFTVEDAAGNRRGRSRDGWTIGGGVEQMVAPNVSVKAEYRYADYASFPARALDVTPNDATARPHRHQLMAGVNYRF